MSLKIALFTDTFVPDVNGVAITLKRWMDYLEGQGHQVMVFAPEAKEKNKLTDKEAIHRYKSFPFLLYPELQAAIPNPIDINNKLNDFQPDIIHVATPFNIGLLGRKHALKHKIPFVASYHTNFDQYLSSYNLLWAKKMLDNYLLWFHKECLAVYVPSKVTANQLINQGYPNVELWQRGVEHDLFKPLDQANHSREEVIERYDLDSNKKTILYVGRLAKEKSIDILIDIASQLPEERLETMQFVLVGDGPKKEHIENLIQSKNLPIYLLGFRSGQELAEIYRSADLFFFPSSTETFGNVVLEALSSGIPVIGANAGGVKELVQSNTSGILCPPGDVQAFAKALYFLVDNPKVAQRYSLEAREFALTMSWEAIFDRLLQSYQEVIDQETLVNV